MDLFKVYPLWDIDIVRAEGSYVWDDKGTRYLDMYGGHAVISIGHTHPHYVEKVVDQLKHIGFYSNSVIIDQQRELASKLGELSGKRDYQLFLCNSGAEANENAMKLASFVTGKSKVIAMKGAFHGRTSLAVAATDNPSIVAPVNRTDHVVFVPLNDEAALEAAFEGGDVSSVIIENIQGVGGVRMAGEGFVRKIRSLCDRYGALYIADEVQCGCGRSGKYYAADWAGVDADIYTMAKGLGNGFPIGAISIAPHIAPKFGMLGTTFGGNHLACAAAIAVADVMAGRSCPRAGRLPDRRVEKAAPCQGSTRPRADDRRRVIRGCGSVASQAAVRREDFRRLVGRQEYVPPASGAQYRTRACRPAARGVEKVVDDKLLKKC